MAQRFEILEEALVITDTGTSAILFEQPKSDVYYIVGRLFDRSEIQIYDKNSGSPDSAVVYTVKLADAQDSGGTTFTAQTFIDFARPVLGFSPDSGGSGSVVNAAIKFAFSGLNTESISNTTVRIYPGECGADDGDVLMSLSSNLDVDITSSGLDTGNEANSTWYYIWLFRDDSDSGFTARFSTSSTSPTIPSGFIHKRLVGVVRNDSSGNFRQFKTKGESRAKRYVYDTEIITLNNVSYNTRTLVSVTDVVPAMNGDYPLINVTVEFVGYPAVIYNGSQTSGRTFIPTSSMFATVTDIFLNTSGQFGIGGHNGTISNLYLKVYSFNLEL